MISDDLTPAVVFGLPVRESFVFHEKVVYLYQIQVHPP